MPRKTRAPISPSPCRRTRQRCGGFLPARSCPRRTQSFDRVSFVCPVSACGGRTPYGSPCGYPWVTPRMRLTDFCFPTTSTTSTRVPSIPGMVTGLSPDSSWGTVRFTTRRSASVGPSSSSGERSLFFHRPKTPNLWHPCRLPFGCPSRFRSTNLPGPPDRFRRPPVKAFDFPDPGCLPSSGDRSLVAGRVSVAGSLGAALSRSRGFAAASRFSPSFRAQLPPPVREASPAS